MVVICVITLISFPHLLVAQNVIPKGEEPKKVTVESIVGSSFIPYKAAPVMLRIAKAESGFNPHAKNPESTASGVFQILTSTFKDAKCEGDIFDVYDNTRCARKLLATSGTQPWLASKNVWNVVN